MTNCSGSTTQVLLMCWNQPTFQSSSEKFEVFSVYQMWQHTECDLVQWCFDFLRRKISWGKYNGKRLHGGAYHKTTSRVGCCSQMDGRNSFLKSWQRLPSEGIFQRTCGSIHGKKNLLNTPTPDRVGKNKVDYDVITQERSSCPYPVSTHPIMTDMVESNSLRWGKKEREVFVKIQKVDQT